MRDALDGCAICLARKIAGPVDDVSIGPSRLISRQREAGDECTDAHLAARIDIGHLPHHEVPALPMDEVALIPQPLEVGITTEQCA
jgi:hypothetical protein